jgi:hypothetical protein
LDRRPVDRHLILEVCADFDFGDGQNEGDGHGAAEPADALAAAREQLSGIATPDDEPRVPALAPAAEAHGTAGGLRAQLAKLRGLSRLGQLPGRTRTGP